MSLFNSEVKTIFSCFVFKKLINSSTLFRSHFSKFLNNDKFKAFIYLTDVDSELEGPYCAIPGSHKWRGKRLLNILTNLITGSKRSDMHRYIGKRDDYFLAKKGTLILSTQTLFHRGSPKHERKTRYKLINYFKAEVYDDGKEFELGKPEEWMMN